MLGERGVIMNDQNTSNVLCNVCNIYHVPNPCEAKQAQQFQLTIVLSSFQKNKQTNKNYKIKTKKQCVDCATVFAGNSGSK